MGYRAAGRMVEAIPLYERTLADCEQVLGDDHPDTNGARGSRCLDERAETAQAHISARQPA